MSQPFATIDFPLVERLWRDFFPERYHVSEAALRRHTVDHPLFDWGASGFAQPYPGEIAAFLAIKKSANPALFPGPMTDVAHITALAFTDAAAAVDLLADAKRILRERGIARLVFGADCGHFFPGCPEECRQLRDFLTVEGFQPGPESVDVEADLRGYEPPDWAMHELVDPIQVRPLEPADIASLEEFLQEEFPGRWRFDVLSKAQIEAERGQILVLVEDGRVGGFAYTQDSSTAAPIAGAVWNLDLGENWGALGPIGISKRLRGRKLGHALLAASLADLKQRGVHRCIIDWTTLVDFYGVHGFEVSRRYTGYALDLSKPLPDR